MSTGASTDTESFTQLTLRARSVARVQHNDPKQPVYLKFDVTFPS